MSRLPHEVIVHILEFDGTYKKQYSLCMTELNRMYLLHKQILYPYNYDNKYNKYNKYVFRPFSVTFFNK